MTTILELRLILQNIWRRVVINILINISPSNIFLNMFLPAIFHQNCQAVLDVVSINGLNIIILRSQKPLQLHCHKTICLTNLFFRFNLLMLKDFLQILSSASIILLTITLKLRKVLQNIWRRVVGDVLPDISPSNIFLTMPFPARFYQNDQAALAAVGINGYKEYFTSLELKT